MSANEIHVGDIGTRITITLQDGSSVVDISGATTKQIWIRDPDGNCEKATATFTTDGSDGKIYYDSLAATFDEPGDWEIQGYVVTSTTTHHSDLTTVGVHDNADRT